MKTNLYNQKKENIGTIELNDKIFNVSFNADSVSQVVRSILSSRRQPIAHTKNRGEVRGGGRKPWVQKGTGRARAGSIRSPIWRHGGITFGPRQNEENYNRKVNQKLKNKTLAMLLSQKLKDSELFIIDEIKLPANKTKEMAKIVSLFIPAKSKKTNRSIYLILDDANKSLIKATRNLPFAFATTASSIDLIDLLNYKNVVILQTAIPILEQKFSKNK